MWKRTAKDGPDAGTAAHHGAPGLGVGVQVYIREPELPSPDDWSGEPTGVIVGPGDRGLRNVYGPFDRLTMWTVSFFEPQFRRDGRGPYERAVVQASLLVAEEPFAD